MTFQELCSILHEFQNPFSLLPGKELSYSCNKIISQATNLLTLHFRILEFGSLSLLT